MRQTRPIPVRVIAIAAALALAGCATPSIPPTTMSTVSTPATPQAKAGSASDAESLKPFAEVSKGKGAQRQDGDIPVWRRQDKVWLEIAPDLLGKPRLLTVNFAQSLGERGFYASMMGPRWMVAFHRVRADAAATMLEAKVLFAMPRIPAPPPGAPQLVTIPTIATLPGPRVGYFTGTDADPSNDFSTDPRVQLIRRWRLEKTDPQAALSMPVKPITYWLDASIPVHYRASIRAGALEWNKAFARSGLKDAIVVREQEDEADFNGMDSKHASIRWFAGADLSFATALNHDDPRTREILAVDSFHCSPKFLASVGPDSMDLKRSGPLQIGAGLAESGAECQPAMRMNHASPRSLGSSASRAASAASENAVTKTAMKSAVLASCHQ